MKTAKKILPTGFLSFSQYEYTKEVLKQNNCWNEEIEKVSNLFFKQKIQKIKDLCRESKLDKNKIQDYSKKIYYALRYNLKYPDNIYIKPDIRVQTKGVKVEIKIEGVNILNINKNYEDIKELKEDFQYAKELLRNIKYKNQQLYQLIMVLYQNYPQNILLEEKSPIEIKEIAQLMNISTNTVYRIIKNKYIEVNGCIQPLKELFKSEKKQQAQRIKNQIEKIIRNTKKNISDNKIRQYLKEEDIIISRRTVNKYRNML